MDKLIILVLLLFVLAYAFSALFKEELHINTLRVFIVIYGTLFGECSTLCPTTQYVPRTKNSFKIERCPKQRPWS
jgi:hypothetical protein